MQTLPDLPPEIISMFTNLIPGTEIGRLWLCGSRNLNWKLLNGTGVRSFRLTHLFPNSLAGWISFVSQLKHLEHLAVVSLIGKESITDLSSLPPSIRNMTLNFPSATASLELTLERHPSLLPNLTALTLSGTNETQELIHLPKLPKLLSFSCRIDYCQAVLVPHSIPPQITH
jgi:hypothetical protein